MSISLSAAAAPATERIGTRRLAAIFIRFRLRSMRNAFRARGRGRSAALASGIGVFIALMYVGLFTQSFSTVVATVDLDGQLAVLGLVIGTIAFGSLAARAASNEAVRAGSPENEFLLARPVSLPQLVVARGVADAVTDPVGGLFLLPVLISATVVWGLGAAAWPMAIAISLLVQIGISTLAYAVQLAVVRYVPGKRRRIVWQGLRLVAALSLATLWMLGTYVMRAPAELAVRVRGLAGLLAFSPATLVSAPMAALVRGHPGNAIAAIATLAAGVGAAMLLTAGIARRAGMSGWEEAGAVWAEATRTPSLSARLPTAATKDLRLIARDRSQLLALIAMPLIFVGVQVFGAAGWTWTTASLSRVSCFAYSLALYMGTIGPLTHMQAERRAFWILRSVPVPLGHLFAAKARAWAIIVGGIAAMVFAALSVSVPATSIAERIAAGVLVTAGAAGMAFVAVAMASGGADLSDETRTAVGPTTVYAYLFVGGLFNLVLVEDSATRVAGLVLYAIAGWTYWMSGLEQAAFCMDAEVVRQRRLRASDGATMVILYAVGGRAVMLAGQKFGREGLQAAANTYLGLAVLIAVFAAIYLARRPRARPVGGVALSLVVGTAVGACVGGIARALAGPALSLRSGPAAILSAISILAEEIVLRGVLQRALQEHVFAGPRGVWRGRFLAAAVSTVVGVAAGTLADGLSHGAAAVVAIATIQLVASLVYALTGRVSATWLARAVVVGVAAFV